MTTMMQLYGLPASCRRHLCDGGTCFYCRMPLSNRHEHDHFPVPKRYAGVAVVAVCYNCHDLKDRMTPEDWGDVESFIVGTQELFDVLTELEPEIMGRSYRSCEASAHLIRSPQPWYWMKALTLHLDLSETAYWDTMSGVGRLVFAKSVAMACDIAQKSERTQRNRQVRIARWTEVA